MEPKYLSFRYRLKQEDPRIGNGGTTRAPL